MNLKTFLDDKKPAQAVVSPVKKAEIFFETVNLSALANEPQMINGIQPNLMKQWKLAVFYGRKHCEGCNGRAC